MCFEIADFVIEVYSCCCARLTVSGDVTVFASLWVDSQEATVVPFAVLGLPDCSLSVFAAGFLFLVFIVGPFLIVMRKG